MVKVENALSARKRRVVIRAKETCKFLEHLDHLLPKLPNFEEITIKNNATGLVVYSVICNIVKANGTRVNVIIFSKIAG
jgi:hypothetical protein